MSVIGSNILAGASGQGGGYNLTNSLRFRSSASAHLTRTFPTASNRKTWTWSGWVKLGVLTGDSALFSANASATSISFTTATSGFHLALDGTYNGTRHLRRTSAVYRDPSAWYHVVMALDTTQATDTNRIKAYINGVQVSLDVAQVGSYPAQNSDGSINNNIQHCIGERIFTDDFKFDGYLTEVNFIDGQALTPSSFGQTSATTGVWQPRRYAGTYGTNGFYLPFTNNSTTTTLGNDFSGNGNNWTTNNISLTAGATYDSMTDVPTLTSATASNFAVMNPLDNLGMTISNGNLRIVPNSADTACRGTFVIPSTGKYYWEVTDVNQGNRGMTGLADITIPISTLSVTPNLNGTFLQYFFNGQSFNNNILVGTYSTLTTNDVLNLAYDADTRRLWIGKNGTWFNSGVPASGTGQVATLNSGTSYAPFVFEAGGTVTTTAYNFGQQPFAYTPPTGFLRLNTFNLPTPTIGATASTQAGKYFNPVLYTGTGSARSVTGVGFQPDFVWLKRRNTSGNNGVYNSVVGGGKFLVTNLTDAENSGGGVSTFDSDGFSFSNNFFNDSGDSFVAWNWKANGTGVTNTAGSITSTVSANTSAGFSIVTYTGNGTGGATVGHGLGVAPAMVIVKERSNVNGWFVYHQSLGNTRCVYLDSTSAQATVPIWNNTTPTSSVITYNNGVEVNRSGGTYVAYCFSEVAGYSSFGRYTGNGSADGPFVFTGFRPRWIMVKCSSSGGDWLVVDTARNTFNVMNAFLYPNLSNAEETSSVGLDSLSNGFKIRNSFGNINTSGQTYIYMAFAEFPFRYSLAR